MDDDQENRRSRAGAVSLVLNNNSAAIAGVPLLVAQVAELDDSIALVDNLAQGQMSETSGVTLNKEQVRETMIRKTLQVAGQLKAWASINKNEELLAKVKISHSSFMDKRDDLRANLAQEIHDLANTNLAALADAGTTAATLSALQTRVDTYKLASPSTREAIVHVSTLTKLLETELRRADTIQRERLDGLMEQFSDTEPNFYNTYHAARYIIDRGHRPPGAPPPPATP